MSEYGMDHKEQLLESLLEAWGASQDSVNQEYALSNASKALSKLIRETAQAFDLTEQDVRQVLQNEVDYYSTITLDYQRFADRFASISAVKRANGKTKKPFWGATLEKIFMPS